MNAHISPKWTRTGFWVAVIVAGMVSFAGAQQAGEGAQETEVMLSTEALIDQQVLNELGRENATVKELMIDPETGCVDVVVIALEGDGEEESTLAVAWSSLAVDPSGSLRLIATGVAEAAADGDRGASASRTDADDSQSVGESRILIQRTDDAGGATTNEPGGSAGASHVPDDRFSIRYDAQSVADFAGVVVGVAVAPLRGRSDDVALLVEDASGRHVRVHLGPKWYVDQLGINVGPDDSIAVTGSTVTVDDQPIVIAAELTANGTRFALREADGTPRW